MKDETKDTLKKVEDTMACSAFAEAGEPCPIDTGGEKAKPEAGGKNEKTTLESVKKDFACTAFHDQNETCPLCENKG